MSRREQVANVLIEYNPREFQISKSLDAIDAIYGVRADDDELATPEWANECVVLPRFMQIEMREGKVGLVYCGRPVRCEATRRQVRMFCEALGVELKESE